MTDRFYEYLRESWEFGEGILADLPDDAFEAEATIATVAIVRDSARRFVSYANRLGIRPDPRAVARAAE